MTDDRNPFLRGPCFMTHRHHACAGIGYLWPGPVQPGDPPERIRYVSVVHRCPCPCGHPERKSSRPDADA